MLFKAQREKKEQFFFFKMIIGELFNGEKRPNGKQISLIN